MGDFNSDNPDWGYETPNNDSDTLLEWASCMTQSREHGGRPLPAGCQVLDDFPRSQHRPSLVHVGLTLPLICSTGKKRWHFRKVNWDKFYWAKRSHHSPVWHSSWWSLQLLHRSHVQSSSLHYLQGSLYYVCTLCGWGSPAVTGRLQKIRRSRYCWPPYRVFGRCETC